MITAKEAKTLYDQSGKEVDDFLSYKVKKYVTEAAMAGAREVTIHLGCVTYLEHMTSKITPLQHAVVDKLRLLGYSANIKQYGDKYIQPGTEDETGNGVVIRNYGIIIGW